MFALTACGGSTGTGNAETAPEEANAETTPEETNTETTPEETNTETAEEADAETVPEEADAAQTMELRLGTSPFVITVPDSFKEG